MSVFISCVLSKGPNDGIEATVKRKVYQETMSGRIVIENAQQLASEVVSSCSIKGRYHIAIINLEKS